MSVQTPLLPAAPPEPSSHSLEDGAAVCSRVWFCWPRRLLQRGYRNKGLVLEDVPPSAAVDDVGAIHDAYLAAEASLPPQSSIPAVLYRTFRGRFWAAGALLVLVEVATVAVPIVLQRLLEELEAMLPHPLTAYCLAAGLCAAGLLTTATAHNFWYNSIRIGVHAKAALVLTLAARMLSMSGPRRREFTAGHTATLMAIDTTRTGNGLVPQLQWDTWGSLVVLTVAAVFLWHLLGWAAVAGFGGMVLCVTLGLCLTGAMKRATDHMARLRDSRTSAVQEALLGHDTIKANNWEGWFTDRIRAERRAEAAGLRRQQLLGALNSLLSMLAPVLVSAASLWLYVILNNKSPTASVAFASLAWFSKIRNELAAIPRVAALCAETLSSYTRLKTYFDSASQATDSPAPPSTTTPSPTIAFDDVTVSYTLGGDPVLRNVSLVVPQGALVAVVGPVGAGKSSLLRAVVPSEMVLRSGSISCASRLGLVEQEAFVFDASVADNVLMGSPVDAVKYRTVLEACGVQAAELPADMLVGSRGVSLSGGQRARLGLARAVYADADVYLLDDPLASLDAQTAGHVFSNCIVGALAGKTRLWVTNDMTLCSRPEVTAVVVLAPDGTVAAQGTHGDLAAAGVLFGGDAAPPLPPPFPEEPGAGGARRPGGAYRTRATKEVTATGRVGWRVIWAYLRELYTPALVALVVLYVAGQALTLASTWWVSAWVDAPSADPHKGFHPWGTQRHPSFYAAVFAGIGAASVAVFSVRVVLLTCGAVRAGTALHDRMTHHVLRAPAKFFHTHDAGTIMNRFAKDQALIDTGARYVLSAVAQLLLQLGGIVAVLAMVTPLALLVLPVVAYPYFWVAQRYRWSARDLQRLEASTRSPLLSLFTEARDGVCVIKAHVSSGFVLDRMRGLLQDNVRAFTHFWGVNQWVTVSLELMGSALILVTAVLVVYYRTAGAVTPGSAGFVLTFVLQVPSAMMWLVRNATQLENDFVSVERVLQFASLPSDAGLHPPSLDNSTAPTLPPAAPLRICDLHVRYSPRLPWVLRGVNLSVPSGAKVAVCGLTGAGKTTLLQAVLGTVPYSGSVSLGGQDLAQLPLSTRRAHMHALLQRGFLFKGTLRENLVGDTPAPDATLRAAVRSVQLDLSTMPAGLDTPIDPGTLSVGQRQLVALARLFVHPRPLICCDESTSSVDEATDAAVHAALTALPSTVLFICHRVVHLSKFDLVVLLQDGCVAHFGRWTPEVTAKLERGVY